MYFTNLLTISYVAIVALVSSLASAAPILPRDVYVPPVLYPHAGTVWYVGQRHNVTWDISNPPVNITNSRGAIYLRNTTHFFQDIPLATGFDILLGHIEVTVPDVTGTDIRVVLFGDSGNWSPEFTIKP
ncbi:hypothetical protein AB1N83_013090 [Pleurotus pulmonarius]|nr:hypothetical protein EYR38_007008 [Pleurotus pulmonarius]